MEDENVDPELIDFIMRMLHLDPEKRISASDALRHDWLIGPLLGYWAVLGVEPPTERKEENWQRQRPLDTLTRDISIESRSSTPEGHSSPAVAPAVVGKSTIIQTKKRLPPVYDFTKVESEDEDLGDEVSQIIYESPTKPLPFGMPDKPPLLDLNDAHDPEEQVLFRNNLK